MLTNVENKEYFFVYMSPVSPFVLRGGPKQIELTRPGFSYYCYNMWCVNKVLFHCKTKIIKVSTYVYLALCKKMLVI